MKLTVSFFVFIFGTLFGAARGDLAAGAGSDDFSKITSLADCIVDVSPTTLVVLDLDNTVFRYPGWVGTSWWDEQAVAIFSAYDSRSVLRRARNVSNTLMSSSVTGNAVELINPEAIHALLAKIREQGAGLLIISSRNASALDSTKAHFAKVSIDLTSYAVEPNEFFKSTLRAGAASGDQTIYERGILLTGGSLGKGFLLNSYFAALPEGRFNKIIVVDDQVKHLQDIQSAFAYMSAEQLLRHFDVSACIPAGTAFLDAHRALLAAQLPDRRTPVDTVDFTAPGAAGGCCTVQ